MALQTKTWETGSYAYQSWSNAYKIHLTLTEESTSTANNTSVVSYKFWISNTDNNRFIDYGNSWSISIGGQTIAINNFDFYVYPYNVTQTIVSGQITVKHNSDGSLNMPYSVSVPNIKASNQYAPPAMALTGNWALTTIPRAATLLTAPNFSDSDNPTITYSNPAGSATESLQACICSPDGKVIWASYRDISFTGSSYTFYLTDTERAALRNATSGTSLEVKFAIESVVGGVRNYSVLYRAMTLDDANPIVTASVEDVNPTTLALTGNKSKLIKYYSTALATMSAEGQKGASIDESLYIIRNGNSTGYSDSHEFANVENNVFTFSAEDSRGNVGTATVTAPMVNYIKLTCNMANNRPDASGNMTVECSGNFFNGSFGAVSNTLTARCRYGSQRGSYGDWYTMTIAKSGNYYSATASFAIDDFNYKSVYVFECEVTDKLDTVTSTPSSAISIPVFHWGKDDFVFEVPTTVNGDLAVTGDLRLKGSGNYGNTLFFGDGSYTTISDPSEDTLKLKATAIDLDALVVTIFGSALADFIVEQGTSGIWTYQKWRSGTAECWCKTNVTVSSSTASGSVAYSNELRLTLPFAMTQTITSGITNNLGYICNSSLSGTELVFYIAQAGTALGTGSYRVELRVKGNWK